MSSRITVLDSFRGTAAISVMLFHFTYFYNSIHKNLDIDYHFKYGHYGVQLFFMISGFVIFMSINKVKTIKDFLYKRFIRLYPTYWICLILTSAFILIFPLKLYSISTFQFLENITMFQGLFKITNIDGSYWSLLPELMFYITMVVVIKFKLHNKINLFCFVWLCAIFLNLLHPSIIEIILNLRFGSLFISGIMFYRIYSQKSRIVEHFLILLSLLANYFIVRNIESSVVFLIFTIVFYLFVYHKLDFFQSKFLTYLGAISYPLYLIHQSIGMTLLNFFLQKGIDSYLCLFFVISLMLGLSMLIYHFFEKSFIKKISKKV